MKRLKHLLWIIPALLAAAVLTLALLATNAFDRDIAYQQTLVASIQVHSNDFEDLQKMPLEFSCEGNGTSPHIEWTAEPEGTRSYALIATDWDAPTPGFRLFAVPHWVLFNVPTNVREIPSDAGIAELTAQSVVVGPGTGGTEGYLPPCPPLGRHQYQFIQPVDLRGIEPLNS